MEVHKESDAPVVMTKASILESINNFNNVSKQVRRLERTIKPNKCPICGVLFNQTWHDANGWRFRAGLGLSILPRINTNCCHCSHQDCVSTSCEEYHREKHLRDYGTLYHQMRLFDPTLFTKEYLRTFGMET